MKVGYFFCGGSLTAESLVRSFANCAAERISNVFKRTSSIAQQHTTYDILTLFLATYTYKVLGKSTYAKVGLLQVS